MNNLIVNARDDLYVTVGAGMPLAALHEALAGTGMYVPLVSPWPAATVGGIVATSLNAPLRMRYGGLRDLVLATTVALPDGRVIRAGRPVVKNVAGYDMPKLFVGAHGTLGLLCDATLKLVPLPRRRESLLIPVHDLPQGIAWGRLLLSRALVASAVVLCDTATAGLGSTSPYALIWSAEGPAEDVAVELAEARGLLRASGAEPAEHQHSGSDAWASWLRAAAALPAGLTLRVGLPQGALPAFAAAHGRQGPHFADLAAGQLYLQGTLDVAGIRTAALAAGGYAVILAGVPEAVHGLDRWGYLPAGLAVMRRLKARWNPGGYVNTSAFVV